MRKIPMRKCVVTQEQFPKQELLRIVLTPEGNVEIDETGRKNGRGAYISRLSETVEKAQKTRALDRALKVKVPEEIFTELMHYVK
ncbi:YlxR family protein [Erysipelothrix sp. HDW6C]|uniref:RNase P modulator RnpM n=1 Tax=Erysipelothrix sp. HDW6C TaxID=2714930 RepID=UPI00140D7785|nr:YlxR family protein [Erysipelothrix sp. HDW6C]QIK70082.1 YlxR family protein [Erysipelothrix sp. HDW6C]